MLIYQIKSTIGLAIWARTIRQIDEKSPPTPSSKPSLSFVITTVFYDEHKLWQKITIPSPQKLIFLTKIEWFNYLFIYLLVIRKCVFLAIYGFWNYTLIVLNIYKYRIGHFYIYFVKKDNFKVIFLFDYKCCTVKFIIFQYASQCLPWVHIRCPQGLMDKSQFSALGLLPLPKITFIKLKFTGD